MTKPKEKKVHNYGVVRRGDKVLLTKKKKGKDAGKWHIYGEELQEGETHDQALARQFQHRFGMRLLLHEKRGALALEFQGSQDESQAHIFEIIEYEGMAQESPELEPRWFHITEIPYGELMPADAKWLPYFLEGKNFRGQINFDAAEQFVDGEIIEVDNVLEFPIF